MYLYGCFPPESRTLLAWSESIMGDTNMDKYLPVASLQISTPSSTGPKLAWHCKTLAKPSLLTADQAGEQGYQRETIAERVLRNKPTFDTRTYAVKLGMRLLVNILPTQSRKIYCTNGRWGECAATNERNLRLQQRRDSFWPIKRLCHELQWQ